jgi:hypothetical protein
MGTSSAPASDPVGLPIPIFIREGVHPLLSCLIGTYNVLLSERLRENKLGERTRSTQLQKLLTMILTSCTTLDGHAFIAIKHTILLNIHNENGVL